jgi:hypothetical protein
VDNVVQGIANGNLLNILALLKDAGGINLKPGQVFSAVVAAQEGNLFFLQIGEKMFPVRAQTNLTIGQHLTLQVLEWHGEELFVRNLPFGAPDVGPGEEREQLLQRILEKFSVRGEKELQSVLDSLAKIPADEQTAVRYLLDPNLVAALLIPQEHLETGYDKLEISRYKGLTGQEEIWEVVFELSLPVLGHMELKLKMVEQGLYLQIWAEAAETETLLRTRKDELAVLCSHVEIVAGAEGPLIKADLTKKIDMMV